MKQLKKYGHTNILDQMELMSASEKETISENVSEIDFDELEKIYNDVYVNRDVALPEGQIQDINTLYATDMTASQKEELKQLGLSAIQNGKFVPVLMAGGQGTRLEHPGPKGTFQFGDISLFELQARQIRQLNESLNIQLPWIIMTSDINHEETAAFFEANQYFGMNKADVTFFKQPNIPALSEEGQLLLSKDREILRTPNGNGGIFEALKTSGLLDFFKKNKIEYVYLNNIDNVLVKVLDPVFCGLAVKSAADVTTKTIAAKTGESVGRVIELDGRKAVMEYTELPEGMEDTYQNANIGIHIFKLDFLIDNADSDMPYHLAIKNLEQMDSEFDIVKAPSLKFEKFYFDIFKYGNSFATMQVERDSEFSPLKNKEGKDSIETAEAALKQNNII